MNSIKVLYMILSRSKVAYVIPVVFFLTSCASTAVRYEGPFGKGLQKEHACNTFCHDDKVDYHVLITNEDKVCICISEGKKK